MKKIIILVVLLALLLSSCVVDTPSVRLGKSNLYTEEEIQAAVDVVIDRFEKSDELKLLRVKYDEDYTLREMEYRKEHYGEETVIVLLVDIKVRWGAIAVGAFSPGQTTTDFQYVLTRDNFGEWIIRDSGYA